MRRGQQLAWVAGVVVGLCLASQAQAQQSLTDEKVTEAINRGVDFLLKSREANGTWERAYAGGEHAGGETALAVYALLHVGESVADKRLKPGAEELQPAIKFLRELKPKSVYAAALQANALALLPKKPENTKPLDQARRLLVNAMLPNGGFTYGLEPRGQGEADNSNSQYALLGAWAAYDAGQASPADFWRKAEAYWRQCAVADGGWAYRGQGNSTVAMTAAGLQCLLITTEHTDRGIRQDMRLDKHLTDGFRLLGEKFVPDKVDAYGLYGVERVGLLSGMKFFGRTNWFVSTAELLVNTQGRDGSWISTIAETKDHRINTSFALLFLARGRNPVVFNKLQYDGPWHARSRDLSAVAEWMTEQYERPFNWQVVNADVHPDEWLDAPALLITGAVDPKFTPQQLAAIKTYVRSGGLIFTVQIGGAKGKEFGEAIRKYAAEVVDNKYSFRELGADSPAMGLYGKIKAMPPSIFGISNGVREMWIHSDEDLSAAWQQKNTNGPAFDIAANIYFYACGREELRTKLTSTAVPNAPGKAVRGITLGRVKWGGEKANWDAEPGAFERLAKLMENRSRSNLIVETVELSKLDFDKHRLTWLNGVGKFEINDDEQAKLKAYLDRGGIMIADAVGGSKEFVESFEAVIKKLYPKTSGATFELLDQAHSLFAGTVEDGTPLNAVKYRSLTRQTLGDVQTPKCWGLFVNKRLAVVWSPHDLSCGLAGVRAWGVSGYTMESAEVLSRNIVLYGHAIGRSRGR